MLAVVSEFHKNERKPLISPANAQIFCAAKSGEDEMHCCTRVERWESYRRNFLRGKYDVEVRRCDEIQISFCFKENSIQMPSWNQKIIVPSLSLTTLKDALKVYRAEPEVYNILVWKTLCSWWGVLRNPAKPSDSIDI